MLELDLNTLGSTIKVAYEGQADTNAFTDAEKVKLDGDQILKDITAYGAIGDNTSHTLANSSKSDPNTGYATLAEAQVDFPLATDLTQEIDAIVIQDMIHNNEYFYIPAGTFLINFEIRYSGKKYGMIFHENASIKANADNDYMFYGDSASYPIIEEMTLNGNNQIFNLFRLDDSSIRAKNTEVKNIGNLTATATILAAGMLLDNPLDVYIDGFKGRNIQALGDATFGDAIGAARFLALGNGVSSTQTGFAYISNLDLDAVGSDAQELDLFQCNIDNIEGGFLTNFKLRYNGNTRRCVKVHSSNWLVSNLDIRKSSDFAADSASTDVGTKNLNCVDWSNNGVGVLNLSNSYIDASGFKVGVSNSGGQADYDISKIYLKGGTKRVIRTHPETGSPENTDHIGVLFVGAGGNGSGIKDSKIENFTLGANLQGDYSYVHNCNFIDPVEYAAYVGSSTNRKGIKFNSNNIISKTDGYLNLSRMIRVLDVTDVQVNNNKLILDGNATYANYFIQFTDADTTGEALLNSSPLADTVNTGTANITEFGTDGTDGTASTNTKINLIDKNAISKNHAAYGDGVSRTVESLYGTLAAAQVDYSNALAGDEIDQVVMEWAINNNKVGFLPSGTYLIRRAFNSFSSKTGSLFGEKGTIVKPATGISNIDAPLFTLTTCGVKLCDIKFDGNHNIRTLAVISNPVSGSLDFNIEIENFGLEDQAATALSGGVVVGGTSINYKSFGLKMMDLRVLDSGGNPYGTYGDVVGGGFYFGVLPASGAYVDVVISQPEFIGGDTYGREIDFINQNVNADNGPGTRVYNSSFKYNTNIRRMGKHHTGIMHFKGGSCVPQEGFVKAAPVGGDPQSDVGERTKEAFGAAGGGSYSGHMIIEDMYIDYSGYPSGIINSGNSTQSRLSVINCTLVGSDIPYSRYDHESAANQQGSSIGFRDGSNSLYGGVENSTFISGRIGGQLVGNNGFIKNCIFDNQAYYGFWVNAYGKTGIEVVGNKQITRTSGYLQDGFHCNVVQGNSSTEVRVADNTLTQAGNTNHRNNFINVSGVTKGLFINNTAPETCDLGAVTLVNRPTTSDIVILNSGKKYIVSKSAAYTAQLGDDVIECTGASAFTVTLPDPTRADMVGKNITVKRLGTAIITIATAAGLIDGATSYSLSAQHASVTVYSDGNNWLIKNSYL